MAGELGMSEKELQEILRQISFVGVAALDEVFMVGGDRTDRTTLGDTIPDATAGPMAMFEDKESKEILAQAIMQLGERERTVLSLYYYEGLTLAEIGEILGRHREPGVPDPHQGRPAAAGPAERPHPGRDRHPGPGERGPARARARAWPPPADRRS